MKSLNSFLMGLLTVCSMVFFVSSCSHDKALEEIEIVGIPENPAVNNDLYKFKDIAHFKSYFTYLDNIYDEDDQAFLTLVEENPVVNTVHNLLANDIFENPEERYQPFLLDPVMMSIVNEHQEFQIKNVLLTHVTNGLFLTSEMSNSAVQSKIRRMPKGDDFDVNLIPEGAFLVSNDKFETLLGPWEGGDYDFVYEQQMNDSRFCSDDNESTGWLWRQNGGDGEAISMIVNTYGRWGRTYEEARVYSYRLENGTWRKRDSDLSASVWAQRRTNNCAALDSDESEQKFCGSCNYRRARVNVGGNKWHQTGDVDGQFRKIYPGGTILDFRTIACN